VRTRCRVVWTRGPASREWRERSETAIRAYLTPLLPNLPRPTLKISPDGRRTPDRRLVHQPQPARVAGTRIATPDSSAARDPGTDAARALAGFDVAGQAQTGTGKNRRLPGRALQPAAAQPPSPERKINAPRALIIAPTRELAVQIHHDAEIVGQYTDLSLGLAFGGVDYRQAAPRARAGVDILIGTPGRLIDFFKQRVFELRSVEVLVLDEADRMFDLGFIADIRYIMRRLPPPTSA